MNIEIPVISKLTKLSPPVYFVQGEKDATLINFKINTNISGVDISGLNWSVSATNCDNELFYTDDLVATETDVISIDWLVSENYTGKPAKLCIMLTGKDSNDPNNVRVKLKFDGFCVLTDCDAAQTMTPSYWDEFLAQIQRLRDESVNAANIAENVELHPVIVGENGNYWNWQGTPEGGSYVDSGITPPGVGDMTKAEYAENAPEGYVNNATNSVNSQQSQRIKNIQDLTQYLRINIFTITATTDSNGLIRITDYDVSIPNQFCYAVVGDGTGSTAIGYTGQVDTFVSNTDWFAYIRDANGTPFVSKSLTLKIFHIF